MAFICADFCLLDDSNALKPKLKNRFGQGRVEPITLNKLIAKTNELRLSYPDIGIVWVTHFPPCDVYANLDSSLLINFT